MDAESQCYQCLQAHDDRIVNTVVVGSWGLFTGMARICETNLISGTRDPIHLLR